MARPADQMNKLLERQKDFEDLLQFYPGKHDLAGYFRVSESTIDRFVKRQFKMGFDELRDKRFGTTRMALRQKQIERALGGCKTMLVWLGKQYLDQSEKIDQNTKLTAADLKEIKINWADEDDPPNAETNAAPTAHQSVQ